VLQIDENMSGNDKQRESKFMGPQMVGVSQNIGRIKELINQVADTGLNTLVSGETGVGKELVVQNLYERSSRMGKPFVKVNCAALPDGLLESELFGYEQGAFTGAQRPTPGCCFWMKSEICPFHCSPKCCTCFRAAIFRLWDLKKM
jgi:transcriptional regulator with GAF, ATPase, and Fis domain